MKTIELSQNTDIHAGEAIQGAKQQPIILTFGSKPIAALLPMADNLTHLAEFDQVIESEETVTLTIEGKPVAVLQPLVPLVLIGGEEVDLEAVTLSIQPQFLALIERSRRRHKVEGGISSAEMRRRLGI